MGARAVRPARLALDPEPVLGAAVVGAEDDDMLAHLLGKLPFDLLACWAVGDVGAGLCQELVGDHAALVGDRVEGVGVFVDLYLGVAAAMVPAELLGEKGAQVEGVQMLFDLYAVERGGHGHSSSGPIRPSEQMTRGSRLSASP